MKTFSNRDFIYIGKESGRDILRKIKGAMNSVKIVSPYLSGSYIKELVHLHKRGVEVTLITCDKISDETKFSDFKKSDLIKEKKMVNKSGKKWKKILPISLLALLLSLVISSLLSIIITKLLILSGFILVVFLIMFISYLSISETSIKYEPIFRIKVFDSTSGTRAGSTELIHSKIYVIDEEIAFLGSANYTYSGFKTHYESVIGVYDSRAVRDISQEVEELYNSKTLKAKSVEEWGFGG